MPDWKVWRPVKSSSSSSSSTRFRLHFLILELSGLSADSLRFNHSGGVAVQVEWRGNKSKAEVLWKGTNKSNRTSKKAAVERSDAVCWNEGFDYYPCKLKGNPSSGGFKRWMIFLEIHGFVSRWSSTGTVLGKAKINVAEFGREKGKALKIPIECEISGIRTNAELTVTVELFEIETRRSPISTFLRGLSFQFHTRKESNVKNLSSSKDEIFSGDPQTGQGKEEYPKPFFSRILSRKKGASFNSRGATVLQNQNGRASDFDSSSSYYENGVGRTNSLRVLMKRHDDHHPSLSHDFHNDGHWENQSLISRDGQLELVTEIFFASIDQCSERADGGGACAVLVAVIADWLHKNKKSLPLRSDFDNLIREGSLEWRKLCENADMKSRFSDQHFDLETVIKAKVRHVNVETHVSFFSFDRIPDGLEYMKELMPFDVVWDDIIINSRASNDKIYIISWNDHFFVVKVEKETIYLIDTLGERLYEGCNQAYILKFSEQSIIYRLDKDEKEEEEEEEEEDKEEEEEPDLGLSRRVFCDGIASCKEFIKGFLAAVLLRELQQDIENGFRREVNNLYRCLQIEIHMTSPL